MGRPIFTTPSKPLTRREKAKAFLNDYFVMKGHALARMQMAEDERLIAASQGRITPTQLQEFQDRMNPEREQLKSNRAALNAKANWLAIKLEKSDLEEENWDFEMVEALLGTWRNTIFPHRSKPQVGDEGYEAPSLTEVAHEVKVFNDYENPLTFFSRPALPGRTPPVLYRWCPIRGRYDDTSNMTIAQFVIDEVGEINASRLFGDMGTRVGDTTFLLKQVGNALPMDKDLKDTFMAGRWGLVPASKVFDDSPQEYKIELIDPSICCEFVDRAEALTYEDIRGRKLTWLDTTRPRIEFVFWHFATSYLRHIKARTKGVRLTDKLEKVQKQWCAVRESFVWPIIDIFNDQIGDIAYQLFQDFVAEGPHLPYDPVREERESNIAETTGTHIYRALFVCGPHVLEKEIEEDQEQAGELDGKAEAPLQNDVPQNTVPQNSVSFAGMPAQTPRRQVASPDVREGRPVPVAIRTQVSIGQSSFNAMVNGELRRRDRLGIPPDVPVEIQPTSPSSRSEAVREMVQNEVRRRLNNTRAVSEDTGSDADDEMHPLQLQPPRRPAE